MAPTELLRFRRQPSTLNVLLVTCLPSRLVEPAAKVEALAKAGHSSLSGKLLKSYLKLARLPAHSLHPSLLMPVRLGPFYVAPPRAPFCLTSLDPPLYQSQRAHGRLIHDARGIQSVVLLVSG